MSYSKPKMQETPVKPKSAVNSSEVKREAAVAEISMKDFLDFLKISYQVNEAVENPSCDVPEKTYVNWKKLTSNDLISRLKESGVPNKEKLEKTKSENLHIYGETEALRREEALNGLEPSNQNPTPENTEDNALEKKPSAEQTVEAQVSLERLPSSNSLDYKVVKKSCSNRKKSKEISKKEGSSESESFKSFDGEDRAPAKIIKKKLNEVLQEGVLDSVLPYLLPRQQQQQHQQQHQQQQPQEISQSCLKKMFSSTEFKKLISENSEKNEKLCGNATREKAEVRRKSFSKNEMLKNDKNDVEVVIHVCDEIKNLKRDFTCSQKLLVSEMGYFAEVTTGQKLEEMDISVHCDVTIFDWLMRWVQKDGVSQEHWPTLDSSIVIPILMSSTFLQMNALQEYCLHYCKTHINDIIRDSSNLSCINDNLLTRLANMFSNREIESIVDKKDKIQSKLFCKLIVALTEPGIQPHRGHYSSIANLYRCSRCFKLILKNMSGAIYCLPGNMAMNQKGFLYATHVYDSTWNLTDHVKDLKGELKTWRKVYWRLWADCHLLFCQNCDEYFPVHHMSWCRFHIEAVQFFTSDNQKSITYPIGRYSCCGERAYRFETIKKLSGCQYRDHNPNPKTHSEAEILRTWTLHKDVIKVDPPPLHIQEKTKFIKAPKEGDGGRRSPGKEFYWWEGLELIPSKQPPGLLNKLWDSVIRKEEAGNNSENRNPKSPATKSGHSTFHDVSSFSDSSDESCSSSNVGNSEESDHASTKGSSKFKMFASSSKYLASARLSHVRKEKKKKKKKKKKKLAGKSEGNNFWVSKLSTRSNQDNQREFEERTLRKLESMIARKLSGESLRYPGARGCYQMVPAGGIYVKLEQEWREAHCFSQGCPGSYSKARPSGSHITVNGAGFTIPRRSKSKGY